MSAYATRTEPRTHEAFIAFLAALYGAGVRELDDNGDVLHESFAKAVDVLRGDPRLEPHFRRFTLGGYSRRIDALDDSLIRAEQYGWLHFPNPSYERIELAMSPRDASQLLEAVDDSRVTIENAARVFLDHFRAHSW